MSYATRSTYVNFTRYACTLATHPAFAVCRNGVTASAAYLLHNVHMSACLRKSSAARGKESSESRDGTCLSPVCPQDAENAISEYDLGQYDEARSDLDTILDNGTLSGASSKYVRQARPLSPASQLATSSYLSYICPDGSWGV